jgi:hypothetical protein
MMNVLLAAALGILLAWTDNSNNEDGFRIWREVPGATFEAIAEVAAGVTTWKDGAVIPLSCYRVTAFNLAGESAPSNTVCLPDAPVGPSNLTVTIELRITPQGSTP